MSMYNLDNRTSVNNPAKVPRVAATFNVRKRLIEDLVLPVRLPALIVLGYAIYATWLYKQSNKAFEKNARFGTVRGRLIEIKKHNYFYNAVPRYTVHYEFSVDGVKYESRRATSGSFFRDWMTPLGIMTDTITESQYLQAFPVLRNSEPCTVFYDKKCPGAHSSIASDANSAEAGIALYMAVFPLMFANKFKADLWSWRRRWVPKRYRVQMPSWSKPPSQEAAMPPPPLVK